jgi:hypothetical protein
MITMSGTAISRSAKRRDLARGGKFVIRYSAE